MQSIKKESTSIHNLNADKGLGFLSKIAYLFLNWINNILPGKIDKRIQTKHFNFESWEEVWESTYATSSPARKFSDLFWHLLPWIEIKEEFGDIHVFDTGCGTGNYGARIYEASGGAIASYTGVDAKPKATWSELESKYPGFKLIKSSSSDIRPLIPAETNFFITQSAIEHFDEDLTFFEHIRSHISQADGPIMQIHLFPAAATLPLYLFHGIRQYTPRTISKITRLFDGNAKIYLFGLGGKRSFRLHWRYFTWPSKFYVNIKNRS